jgi:ribosome-binding factor A
MEEPLGRMVRVDKLIYQSLADLLRARFHTETIAITLTGVKTSPDLYNAHVTYSVIGDDKASAVSFFRKNGKAIGREFAKLVKLKRHPRLHFVYDDSIKKMADVDRILTELERDACKPLPNFSPPPAPFQRRGKI